MYIIIATYVRVCISPAHLSALSLHLSPQDYPAIVEGLDLVQEDDQITHLLSLSDSYEGEEILNVFQEDPGYLANEDKYREIKAGELWVDPLSHTHTHTTHCFCLSAEILGERSSDEEGSSGDESDEEESDGGDYITATLYNVWMRL